MRSALALVLALVATPAVASPDTAEVDISSDAEACPAPDLMRELESRAGALNLAISTDATRRATIAVHGSTALTATVTFTQVDVARVLEAPTCGELADAIALVLAMVASQPPAPVFRAIDPEPVPEHAPESPPPVPSFATRAGVLAGLGVRSDGRWLVMGGARWRLGAPLSLGVEGAVVMPSTEAMELGAVRTARGEVAVAPCLHVGQLAACGVIAVGALRASGEGFAISRSTTAPTAHAGLRIAAELPVARSLTARAHVEVRTPLVRNRLLADDLVVWASPAAEIWVVATVIAHVP